MNINLSEKIDIHFHRLENLAQEADTDENESFSSRASAMSALTSIIRELTKAQSEVVNMERLMKVEKKTIEVLKKYLSEDQQEQFLDELEAYIDA